MDGDLGRLGDGPQKNLRLGDGPCIRPPNVLRSSVVGCARKYEESKKWCHEGIILWNRVFSREERGSYMIFVTVKMWKIWWKILTIWKTWSMTKKKSSEILSVKIDIFSWKNLIQKSWSAKFFSVPQTRRQVYATESYCDLSVWELNENAMYYCAWE